MDLKGSLVAEVEMKSDADKVWGFLAAAAHLFPKALPKYYKAIQILNADGMSPGAVALVTYGEGFPTEISKERIDEVDLSNRSFTYSVLDEETLRTLQCKSFKGTLSVAPKPIGSEGSVAKYFCEYEKASHSAADPQIIADFKVKNYLAIDEYLLSQEME